jgi:hypothetical protein
MLECSDTDSHHSVDDVAVIDTLVNSYDYDEVVAASAENYVWESVSNYTG